jgi:uncharacterized protein
MSYELIGLLGFAFLAGLVDAVVGGGGLIQLPALLVLLPQQPIPMLFGTNKLSSIAGTSVAVVQYGSRVALPWGMLVPGALAAGLCSFLGARAVQWLQPHLLKPLVLVALMAVGTYTLWRKDLGQLHQPSRTPAQQRWIGAAIAAVIGFYDGFLGPGTGSFLIFAQISLLGFDFLTASAGAKVLNWATNLAAIAAFGSQGQVLYAVALPMALCNVLGAVVGSRLALLKGSQFIRRVFLAVVGLLITKLVYDLLTT